MTDDAKEVRFPAGNPTRFQVAAVLRISEVLRSEGVRFDAFVLNVGAKRGFWTSFTFDGREHIVSVYPDELNLLVGTNLYENYLRAEFRSEDALIDSFARRLTRFLRDGSWELPEEIRPSPIARAIAAIFRRRPR